MKWTHAILLAFLAVAAGGARAQSSPDEGSERSEKIHYQLILPEEKAPEVVKPTEPNPFTKADSHIIKDDGASGEENRVREILASLPVTGFVDGGDDGPRVLLGPMKLKRGDQVPKVLAEQSVMLHVNSISRKEIVLVWVEKKKSTGMAPRLVNLPVHVDPKVRIELPSAPKNATASKDGSFMYQGGASGAQPDAPPETRRATAAEDSNSPPTVPPPAAPDPKIDPNHPANLLMNYLFKSANKTVEAPAPPAPK